MPRYQYIAIAGTGKKVKGAITAESPYAARKQLRMRSVHPSSIKEITSKDHGGAALTSLFRKKNKNQLIDFTKQMATLLNSGIKLTEALSVLTLQISDVRFRAAIVDIRDRVGEVTGILGESFETIANFMEKRRRVESKVVTAMIYPIVLIFFCIAAILILTTLVIPKIGEQIQSAGKELPWLTQRLMDIGHIMTSGWLLVVIAGVIGIVWGIRRFVRTNRGAYLRDKFLLSLPVFGPLIKQRVVARFASTLSTLLGSGLAMAESLRVVSEVTGNTLMRKAIQNSRERILAGADIATPLRDSGVIDPAIAHMVAVGEKSGELETMLKSISDNLESSTDIVIERLSAAVEPVIIIVMAGIIGIIAYATISPILDVSAGNF